MPPLTQSALKNIISREITNDLRGLAGEIGKGSYNLSRLEQSLPDSIAKAIAAAVKDGVQ